MKITIETASNGYIIRYPSIEGDDEIIAVIGEKDPVDATFLLLGEILELIGHIGSRYDERRVRITIEPGDKWLSKEDWQKELNL